MAKLDEVKTAVEKGKTKLAAGLVQEALDEGLSAKEILAGMIEAMGVVGEKFSAGEIFVPEMLVAARAMSKGVEVLKPLLATSGAESLGLCLIGTVAGDLHDIGKNLVAMMIESAGFDVIDLGIDVADETFCQAVKDHPEVKLVACSGLLTTTMPSLKSAVAALNEIKPNYNFKIIVGGAPVTQAFADEIGADGYAVDAGAAAIKAKEMVKDL